MPEIHIPQIDVVELASRLADGAHLVDVREADEYAEGHVPGAQLVPLSEWPEAADRIPPGGVVHLICASGRRSQNAAEYLAAAHGRDVVNVAGGTSAWVEDGGPVEIGPPSDVR